MVLEKGRENMLFILISFVPVFNGEEHKTKPTQNAITALRLTGITADFLVLRSDTDIDFRSKEKVGQHANLRADYVVSMSDCSSIFEVPLKIENSNMPVNIMQKLGLPIRRCQIDTYRRFLKYQLKDLKLAKKITIAIVGKYTDFQDCYLSVIKALESASWKVGVQLDIVMVKAELLEREVDGESALGKEHWNTLRRADGIVIPGGYGLRGFEGKILAAQFARENDVPILGICFGFQAMVAEFARNVLGIADAQSKEFQGEAVSENWVICEMEDASTTVLGGTMRKGSKKTLVR